MRAAPGKESTSQRATPERTTINERERECCGRRQRAAQLKATRLGRSLNVDVHRIIGEGEHDVRFSRIRRTAIPAIFPGFSRELRTFFCHCRHEERLVGQRYVVFAEGHRILNARDRTHRTHLR